MLYFDVCTKREWEQNGAKKHAWLKCGTMRKTDDGKTFLELNMFPNTSFYVFPQKKKEDEQPPEDF